MERSLRCPSHRCDYADPLTVIAASGAGFWTNVGIIRRSALNAKHRPIGLNTVSVGSLTASTAHPREVFKPALTGNAAAVIVAHNHPSGDPAPSAEDVQLTKRLRDAGELLGIRVLDHVILGDGKYYSFVDAGAW